MVLEMDSSLEAERKIIQHLADLLKKNADRIYSGESKLCLTTSSLGILSTNFRRVSESDTEVDRTKPGTSALRNKQAAQKAEIKRWRENTRTLFDFVVKTVSLKVIHGSYTMHAPIQIAQFRALQVLEVKRVPIHMVEGLSKLRGQLSKVIVSRSLQKLENLFEICGGDRSSGMAWPQLKSAYLSYNGLSKLDNSLRFIPFLEVLDLSHNNIETAEDFMQNLTAVLRLNLGFNMLGTVPQFSYSNKGKLRTLVLRRNNLDNLEGLEELGNLEELDVADNCLVDHQCLYVLADLRRLNILCLTGNPLFYKAGHRAKTLEFVSPQAGLGLFLLDNTQLNAAETLILQNTHYTRLVKKESSTSMNDNSVDPGPGTSDRRPSNNLLKPNGQHLEKKKHGHRRIHSRERIPVIVNLSDSDSTDSGMREKGSSPTGSYVEDPKELAALERERRKIEIMRDHYKEDWLMALSAEHYKNGDSMGKGLATDSTDNTTTETPGVSENITKEEVPSTQTTDTSVHPPETQKKEEAKLITIEDTTDIYAMARMAPSILVPTKEQLVYSEPGQDREPTTPGTAIRGVEWTRSEQEQEEHYGEESEPLIVTLLSGDQKEMFVTVNDRYIIEKDMHGHKQAMLDLKCLQTVSKTDQSVDSSVVPVIRLTFDYVRKDLRERVYGMEDESYAQMLKGLLEKHMQAKEQQRPQRVSLQCLKCQNVFQKSNAAEENPRCPKCKNKIVIELSSSDAERVTKNQSPVASPAKSTVSAFFLSRSVSPSPNSGDSKNGKLKRKDAVRLGGHEGSSKSTSPQLQRRSTSPYTNTASLGHEDSDKSTSPWLQRRSTSPYTNKPSSFGKIDTLGVSPMQDTRQFSLTGKSEKSDASGTQGDSLSEVPRNTSWSDVKRSESGQLPRNSISSVDSDITILGNSSRSSVTVISESSREEVSTGSGKSETGRASKATAPSTLSQKGSGQVTADKKSDWTEEQQGQVTPSPVGSPLSSSICSSMVSSVYENTLATAEGGEHDGKDLNATDSSNESVTVRPASSEGQRGQDEKKDRRKGLFSKVDFGTDSGPASLVARFEESVSKIENESVYVTAENTQEVEADASTEVYPTVSIYDEAPDYKKSDTKSDGSLSPDVTVRKKGSRASSKKRSGFYGTAEIESSSLNSDNGDFGPDTLGIPEDLSPIKRTGFSRRSLKKKEKRSGLFVEDSDSVSKKLNKGDNSNTLNVSSASASSSYSRSFEEAGESPATDMSQSAAEIESPWEKSPRRETTPGDSEVTDHLDHDEFVNIDHRLQLYLELKVFKEGETCQCALQCNVVQYMKPEVMPCFLVISSTRIHVFQIMGEFDSESSSDWLKCLEDQPITELRFVDIGLGYQSLRMEFKTVCSSFTFLIADQGRCQRFLTLLTAIVQDTAISGHSKLEGISKSNPTTLGNLQTQVLQAPGQDDLQELVKYFIVQLLDADDSEQKEVMSLVVTKTDICLVKENHQWPLPRLQAPLSESMRGQQFTVKQRENINNIETFEFNEYTPTELRLSFFDEGSEEKVIWVIAMETTQGVKSLVDSIREPWEDVFGVTLDVTPVSFSDD